MKLLLYDCMCARFDDEKNVIVMVRADNLMQLIQRRLMLVKLVSK